MKTKIFLGLAVVFLVLQAFRPAKNLSATAPFTGKDDITVLFSPPPEVRQILATSCYDCHSNQTKWPWYTNVAPASWLVENDVKSGRPTLNFSDWNKPQDTANGLRGASRSPSV